MESLGIGRALLEEPVHPILLRALPEQAAPSIKSGPGTTPQGVGADHGTSINTKNQYPANLRCPQ